MIDEKLKKKAIKYNSNEKFIIARRARQTLNFIVKNTESFPMKYVVLKNNIISEAYSMLRNIYKANILQEMNDKKEIIVNIEMLNYYLDEALRKGILTKKKFLNYVKFLYEIDRMVRVWIVNEKSRTII